jgi:CRP/FNR family cyclic AMP-dependent transcriptional regulator
MTRSDHLHTSNPTESADGTRGFRGTRSCRSARGDRLRGDMLAARMTLLRRLAYMAALDEGTLRSVASVAARRSYRAGELLSIAGEPCQGLMVVETGRVKASLLSPGGREHILDICVPGEAVNEAEVFGAATGLTTVQALEDATLLVISCSVVYRMIDQHPAVARAVIEVLAGRCRRVVDAIADLSLRPVAARLAGLLLDYAVKPDGPTLTRGQMAARLGTVREVVSRSLRDLECSGLIRVERGQIVIIREGDLTRLAERS